MYGNTVFREPKQREKVAIAGPEHGREAHDGVRQLTSLTHDALRIELAASVFLHWIWRRGFRDGLIPSASRTRCCLRRHKDESLHLGIGRGMRHALGERDVRSAEAGDCRRTRRARGVDHKVGARDEICDRVGLNVAAHRGAHRPPISREPAAEVSTDKSIRTRDDGDHSRIFAATEIAR
jgi:hypothetical protein